MDLYLMPGEPGYLWTFLWEALPYSVQVRNGKVLRLVGITDHVKPKRDGRDHFILAKTLANLDITRVTVRLNEAALEKFAALEEQAPVLMGSFTLTSVSGSSSASLTRIVRADGILPITDVLSEAEARDRFR
ncbi:MAG: hypothetical protein Q8P13_02745 [bacterium]|nr:hypothetical protein [bacterium]